MRRHYGLQETGDRVCVEASDLLCGRFPGVERRPFVDHMDAADRHQSGHHVLVHGHHAGAGLRNGLPLGHPSAPLARDGLHSAPSLRSFQNSVLSLSLAQPSSGFLKTIFLYQFPFVEWNVETDLITLRRMDAMEDSRTTSPRSASFDSDSTQKQLIVSSVLSKMLFSVKITHHTYQTRRMLHS